MIRARRFADASGTGSTRRRQFRRVSEVVLVVLVLGAVSSAGSSAAGSRAAAVPPSRSRRATLTATQPVVFVPGTIDYTGTTDVTIALQAFLDRVPNGRLVRFHRNGRYRVEGTLLVTDRTGLTFDGQNATIFATTRGSLERAQWFLTGGGGITFRHLIVRGANPDAGLADQAYVPSLEKQHGFRIEGVQGLELDHVTVTDVYGDFVYLAREFLSGVIAQPSTNVWIHDSTFRRDGRQGISVVCATNVIIERNTFGDTRRSTIDLEPNGPNQTDSNVFILNNSVGPGRLLFVASHGQGPVNDVVISGNRLHNHLMTIDDVPPNGERRQDWIVTNNVGDVTAHHRPMRFVATDGVLVSGNTQAVSDKQPGLELANVCTAPIEHNDFGTGGVLRTGPKCAARLVIPTEPIIPGRCSTSDVACYPDLSQTETSVVL